MDPFFSKQLWTNFTVSNAHPQLRITPWPHGHSYESIEGSLVKSFQSPIGPWKGLWPLDSIWSRSQTLLHETYKWVPLTFVIFAMMFVSVVARTPPSSLEPDSISMLIYRKATHTWYPEASLDLFHLPIVAPFAPEVIKAVRGWGYLEHDLNADGTV